MNGEPVVVKEGQIVYIPCGCTLFCQTLSQPFEFFSVRFTTSVFYDREDLLKDYYRIAKVSENQGEDVYFKEIYRWAKTAHPAKKCFLRGYLEPQREGSAPDGRSTNPNRGRLCVPSSHRTVYAGAYGRDGGAEQTTLQQSV